ncbi:hypothetical protein [Mycobacteroides abscessus]|uniref:hypothetical protein n=1 Tax=Mycobacteroides abscessus TaxID=36809 RepID=UPI0009D162B7|nr:hypothetical protein [Mycobacteroides abscessus]SKD26583.1 Uncharacterised protein [Mycobacteroides abscessus subsp. massiliense]SKI14433.1 Uncharacterised protein [Mycobacteroides abscessus subsp. massiliense]SKL96936.1 Uncharacterised protein [Mycobacteroides abscessus subsp. massiliense]SKM69096.1 Uncharacterised protein [Mycobacteroides abscessus subsp. massiliense]SKN53661.1 Uncharacterised protein [Mycobacteroides abscessus subsp. massiliense]
MTAESIKTAVLVANSSLAIVSFAFAWMATRRSRISSQIDALIKVAEWFREPDVVASRKRIYSLIRVEHEKWGEDDKNAIDIWVAYVDIVATLIITKNISRKDFIRMYGDVIFRTLYILAPFVGKNLDNFGQQYLKSTRIVLPSLIKDWNKLSKDRGRISKSFLIISGRSELLTKYPRQIVIQNVTTPLTPKMLENDTSVQQITKI